MHDHIDLRTTNVVKCQPFQTQYIVKREKPQFIHVRGKRLSFSVIKYNVHMAAYWRTHEPVLSIVQDRERQDNGMHFTHIVLTIILYIGVYVSH